MSDPGLGMEWRLVAIGEGEPAPRPKSVRAPGVPPPPATDPSEIVAFAGHARDARASRRCLRDLPAKRRKLLPRAGIVSLDQVAAMTDEQLVAIDGVGHGMVRRLREALARARPRRRRDTRPQGLRAAQAGLPHLGEEDPMRSVLAGALPSLAAALGEAA